MIILMAISAIDYIVNINNITNIKIYKFCKTVWENVRFHN